MLTLLRLTHRSQKLERYALALGEVLVRLLQADACPVEPLVCAVAERLGFAATTVVAQIRRTRQSDHRVIGGLLSPACYIDQSFPAVLYLAARYPDDFEAALIANTNVGGDNCHRGAILGAILGAALGSGHSRTLDSGTSGPRRIASRDRAVHRAIWWLIHCFEKRLMR